MEELAMNEGLLIARLVLGVLMAAHGAQKLFGWFGGYGLTGTAGFFESIGFHPGRLFATAAAVGEVVSGLLVALGFLGPVGPALMLAVMIVAASVHWPNGVFAQNNGYEVPLLYGTVAVALALIGPGRFSLDALLGLSSLSTPIAGVFALLVAIAGGFGNVAIRRTPHANHS
jgi:putative oxidoreductase